MEEFAERSSILAVTDQWLDLEGELPGRERRPLMRVRATAVGRKSEKEEASWRC